MLDRMSETVLSRIQDVCDESLLAPLCCVSRAVRTQCLPVLYKTAVVASYTGLVELVEAFRGPNGRQLRKLVRVLGIVEAQPLHPINAKAVAHAIKKWLPRLPNLREVVVREHAIRSSAHTMRSPWPMFRSVVGSDGRRA